MKRSVLKAIRMTGKFEGKSNALGQGGRAAQLKARGVPGGVIGNLARAAHAAPGQKNYHKKVRKEGEPNNIGNEAAKKAKKRKTARKGIPTIKMPAVTRGGMVPKVKLPTMKGGGQPLTAPMKLKRKSAHSYKNLGKFAHKKKSAKKMTIQNSEGDEGPLKKGLKKKSK